MKMTVITTRIKCGQTTSVKTEWENFSKAVFVGVKPSAIQLQEMERAFYAGSYSCLAVSLCSTTKFPSSMKSTG